MTSRLRFFHHLDWRAATDAQSLRGILLGAGDFQHAEGIDEAQQGAGLRIAIGAQQGDLVATGLHQRLGEGLDVGPFDI